MASLPRSPSTASLFDAVLADPKQPPGGILTAQQARNPVALRLYKVLSTNYNDTATREALYTLSDIYYPTSPTTSSETASRRSQAPTLDAEDEATDDAVGIDIHDSSISGEIAARARKNLRYDMERKLAEGSKLFLKAFAEVDQKLEILQQDVDAIKESCAEAEANLALTSEASKTLLERAGSLREKRSEVESKKSIVDLFLSRFTLDEAEIDALTSRDVPIGKRFFEAMDKAERIRDDCRILMAGEEGPTKAGLDIMSSTSSNLEQGFEKISRWCSHEFRQIGKDLHLEASSTLQEAVKKLRKRPELLTEALTFLSQTRQATLLASFLAALTRGGPSGLPRPIELHAHDPMRYVGDMLAWVHQAIAAEREFLETLFVVSTHRRMVGSVRQFNDKSEEEDWIQELMDLAVAKLCVPLKVRIQQTIKSQESSIVAYKIANLLQFYLLTMKRTIGEEALLSQSLSEMTDVAYKIFYDSIESQRRILANVLPDLDDPSLSPAPALLEQMQILREIMSVYQSSLLGDDDDEDNGGAHVDVGTNGKQRVQGFQRVLDVMVDPAVNWCIATSDAKKLSRPKWDAAVYVLNSLSFVQSVLEQYTFTVEKRKFLEGVIEERVAALIDEHYTDLITNGGLRDLVELCKTQPEDDPLSHHPSATPAILQSALRTFSTWLSSPEVLHPSRLTLLSASAASHRLLPTRIHHAALARVAKAYETVCEAVRRKENRYEAAATLLGGERPFGQVYLLLQIFGMEAAAAD